MKKSLFLSSLFLFSCQAHNYSHYVLPPPPKKSEAVREDDNLARPFTYGTTTAMKVRWNDGNMVTEVDIPMLASGQRIVIEHASGSSDVRTLPASRLVPPPPTRADDTLTQAYRARGLRVDESAPEISIVRVRGLLQQAVKAGNYSLGLEWCEAVLARYPSHPEFLRAKASLLLMMGEREKAIETYEKAEAVESEPSVRKTLEELQKQPQ